MTELLFFAETTSFIHRLEIKKGKALRHMPVNFPLALI